jgi:hypothetical protein
LAPPPPVLSTGATTHRQTEKERQLADGTEGRGKEPNHLTARKPDPLKIIQYSLEYAMMRKNGLGKSEIEERKRGHERTQ